MVDELFASVLVEASRTLTALDEYARWLGDWDGVSVMDAAAHLRGVRQIVVEVSELSPDATYEMVERLYLMVFRAGEECVDMFPVRDGEGPAHFGVFADVDDHMLLLGFVLGSLMNALAV